MFFVDAHAQGADFRPSRERKVSAECAGVTSTGYGLNVLGASHRPSACTAVLARREFDTSGATGQMESSGGGQSCPISHQPSFLHRCADIGLRPVGGITFLPCLRRIPAGWIDQVIAGARPYLGWFDTAAGFALPLTC